MDTQVLISISIYFIFMLAIGVYAYKKSTNSLSEYMLGDRGLGPAVTALSAGAADMSGWMLMGLPGAMYATGISSVWIAIGLTVGAYLNYLLLAPRLRVFTEVADNSITIPNYFEKRFQDTSRILRIASAIVIIIFFTLYCSAGLVSGGTLFESAFGIDYKIGLFVTAGVVIAYTLFGGFLAVSLTDFVQGLIMFIALIMVPLVAFTNMGGVKPVFDEIQNIDPKLLNIFTGTSVVGIVSLLAWGLGYFGQPHIIVRFMAISTVKELKPARRIGMSWMLFTIVGAALTGLVGIAYISVNNLALKDPETIFIFFANTLFHPLITGFLLSAILAAIMSTISSQLLVTSSALTEDLYRIFGKRDITEKELVRVGRLSVLIVAVVSLLLSLKPSDTILNLVGNAWAGFGAAFGPAILLSLFWKRMTRWGALAGMIVGALTVIIWISVDVIKQTINLYEMVPGFFFSLVAVIVVSLITSNKNQKIEEQYEEMKKRLA